MGYEMIILFVSVNGTYEQFKLIRELSKPTINFQEP